MQSHTDVEAAPSEECNPVVVESRSLRRTLLTACVAGALALAGLCGTAAYSTVGGAAVLLRARDLVSSALHPASQDPEARKLGINFASAVYVPSYTNRDKRKNDVGNYPWALLYQEIGTLQFSGQVGPYLDQQVQQSIVMTGYTLQNVLDDLNGKNGWIRSQLTKFANDVAGSKKQIYVRIFHEFNGDWYDWCAYDNHNGNTIEKFIQAYNLVAGLLKKESNYLIKMQLAYNCDFPKNNNNIPSRTYKEKGQDITLTGFNAYWPGSDNVDMVCCSAYNMYGGPENKPYQSFSEVFDFGFKQMSSLPWGGDLCVAETSTTDARPPPGKPSKYQWFIDAANDLNSKYGRVKLVNWFPFNESGARSYDVNDDNAKAGLRKAIGN